MTGTRKAPDPDHTDPAPGSPRGSGDGTSRRSRVQQAAAESVAPAGKGASKRVADAARQAKALALPRLSRAREGARHWSELDPDVQQKVLLSLVTAAAVSAGEHMKKADHWGVKIAGVAIAAAGPAMATHTARQVGKLSGRRNLQARLAEPEVAPDTAGAAGQAGTQEAAASQTLEPAGLGECAHALAVRRPPDPESLYRDGPGTMEPLYPLPEGLASLPWGALGRRDRFFVLVAAWALREANGVRHLRSGQLEQASKAFHECLADARHLQTPELVIRSCADLGTLAAATGDEVEARKWRAEAERGTAD